LRSSRESGAADTAGAAEVAKAASSASVAFFDILPLRSSCLSEMLRMNIADVNPSTSEILDALREFEIKRGGGPGASANSAGEAEGKSRGNLCPTSLERGNRRRAEARIERLSYERSFSPADVETWLSDGCDYGKALRAAIPRKC